MFNYTDLKTTELRPVENILHAFQGACRRAKVKDLQFRDLRRTFATRLHRKRVDPLLIQRLLRHSSFKISEEVYIRSNLRMMREALENAGSGNVFPAEVEHYWNTEERRKGKAALSAYFSAN